MAMFSALAEDECNRVITRTHEGRKVSQGRGVNMGRKEKLNEMQKAEARRRLAGGELPLDLAPLYGVSRQTIARLRYSRGRGSAINLVRIDETRNMARFYKLDVQPTLFGA